MKYLVIWYNSEEYGASLLSCDTPDSSVARVWGLDERYDIIAVVQPTKGIENVWIDEVEVQFD